MHSKNKAKEISGEKKRFVNIINTASLLQGLFYVNMVKLHYKAFFCCQSDTQIVKHKFFPTQAFHDFCALPCSAVVFKIKAAFCKKSVHLLSPEISFYFTFLHASHTLLAQVFLKGVPQSPCRVPAQLRCAHITLAEVVVSLPTLQMFPFHSSMLEIFHFFLCFPLRQWLCLSPRALCTFQLQIYTTSLISSPVQYQYQSASTDCS